MGLHLPRLKPGVDPVTGDQLTAGEMASRLVQRIIRRWVFLGTISAITGYIWVIRDPIWHHSPADTWNYFLSWLAIAIESVVGMFFFGQSIRDALVIRAIFRELTERVERMERQTNEKLDRVLLLLERSSPADRPARNPKTGRYMKVVKSTREMEASA